MQHWTEYESWSSLFPSTFAMAPPVHTIPNNQVVPVPSSILAPFLAKNPDAISDALYELTMAKQINVDTANARLFRSQTSLVDGYVVRS